jgi:hypothetical protein
MVAFEKILLFLAVYFGVFFINNGSLFANQNINKLAFEGNETALRNALKGNVDVNYVDNTFGSALSAALFSGNPKIVQILINNGYDINFVNPENGFTPLHYAVWISDINMLEVLLENHARDDIKDKNGFTPLAKAKYEGKEDLVKILQDYKKNPKKFYLKNEERQFDNKSTEELQTIWVKDDNAKNDEEDFIKNPFLEDNKSLENKAVEDKAVEDKVDPNIVLDQLHVNSSVNPIVENEMAGKFQKEEIKPPSNIKPKNNDEKNNSKIVKSSVNNGKKTVVKKNKIGKASYKSKVEKKKAGKRKLDKRKVKKDNKKNIKIKNKNNVKNKSKKIDQNKVKKPNKTLKRDYKTIEISVREALE